MANESEQLRAAREALEAAKLWAEQQRELDRQTAAELRQLRDKRIEDDALTRERDRELARLRAKVSEFPAALDKAVTAAVNARDRKLVVAILTTAGAIAAAWLASR